MGKVFALLQMKLWKKSSSANKRGRSELSRYIISLLLPSPELGKRKTIARKWIFERDGWSPKLGEDVMNDSGRVSFAGVVR